jgi:choline-sulfatase
VIGWRGAAAVIALSGSIACGAPDPAPVSAPRTTDPARNVLLVTIDTLRADHVGAYGSAAARTPVLDSLARDGARIDRAWTTAPITQVAHASLLSGRFPPAHRARHNGMAIDAAVPTLAGAFKAAGFATAAFVSAFPLDRRFGLARGFDVYDDQLGRDAAGRPLNERSGADTVARASAWLDQHRDRRFFLWVHVFDPHAPYGTPGAGGTMRERYANEVSIADRDAGVLIEALKSAASTTLIIATSDHGEAFGEHGEIGHSMFVYDTTLRVPLLMRGPGIPPATVVRGDVSLVDLAPTITALTGTAAFDSDGRSLVPALAGEPVPPRSLYAETFAPLLDFGWASLRSVREGGWKYIAAPKPELYDTGSDAAETTNRLTAEAARASRAAEQVAKWSGPELPSQPRIANEAARRLQSLGYLSGATAKPGAARPDPKDRIEIAAQLARVTSGEVTGEAAITTLEAVLRSDPPNPQAHLRLGYAEMGRNRCDRAEPHFRTALASGLPSADAGLGLAQCLMQAGNVSAATLALEAASRAEPGNPVVEANLGLISLQNRDFQAAITRLRAALQADPEMHEARFALARALASAGDRGAAAAEAATLLRQLPPGAPQRGEVERLINALK